MNKRELVQALVGFEDEAEVLCNGETIKTVEKNYYSEELMEQLTEKEYNDLPESSDDPLDYIKSDFVAVAAIETDIMIEEESEE